MQNSTPRLNHRSLVFDRMTLADVPIVAEIERHSFSAPWSAETYRHELQHNRRSFYWVLRAQPSEDLPELSAILAYGGYWLLDNEIHIMTIATHPNWRRRKLGEWLLLEMLAMARADHAHLATLEVRISNQAALTLYTKLGFVKVGLRKRYYRDNNEDALLLTLFHLDQAAVWQPLAEQLDELRKLF